MKTHASDRERRSIGAGGVFSIAAGAMIRSGIFDKSAGDDLERELRDIVHEKEEVELDPVDEAF